MSPLEILSINTLITDLENLPTYIYAGIGEAAFRSKDDYIRFKEQGERIAYTINRTKTTLNAIVDSHKKTS
jgi:hypothetical protein